MKHAYFLRARICGDQVCDYSLKPFPHAHTLFNVFKAMFYSCTSAPPRLRSTLKVAAAPAAKETTTHGSWQLSEGPL